MGISIDGIVSGLNTTSMIDALVEAASVPKALMQQELDEMEKAEEAFAGLSSRLDDLASTLQDLDDASEFLAFGATSGDEAVVTVSADGDAVAGTYSVIVSALADSDTEVSQGFASKTDDGSVATGILAVTYAGTTTDVTIDAASSSLQDVADAINDQVSGVTAYIMDTGDASTPYRLVVAGDDTGASNTVSIDTTGLDPATGTVPSFSEVSTAADAQLTIDGVSVTSSTNEISGAIQGLTFTARAVSATAVDVTVAADETAMVAQVQAFVDAYNEVMSYVRTNQAYDADEDIKGPFVGDGLISSIVRSLQSVVTMSSSEGSAITSLAQVGISTTRDGDLEFDSDVFTQVLTDHTVDVVAIFTGEADGIPMALQEAIEALTDASDGRISTRIDSLEEEIETQEERISDFEERMDAYEERLRAQFIALEVALGQLQNTQATLSALFATETSESS